jgi:nitrite reductase (NADH) small subunit
MKYRLCDARELPPGEKRAYTVRQIPIVLVHSQDDTFYAVYGLCPHQRGPLAEGLLTGTTIETPQGGIQMAQEGEILRCPWHGFSFDLRTGRCLADPVRLRLRTYPVSVEQHEVFLDL